MESISKTKTIFIVPIALVYAFFSSLMVSKLLGRNEIDNLCKGIPYKFNQTGQKSEYTICNDDKSTQLKKLSDQEFTTMMIISLIGIVVGVTLASNNAYDGKFKDAGIGIASGSVITLIYHIFKNWKYLKQNMKLIMLGGILLGLIYGSYKLTQ